MGCNQLASCLDAFLDGDIPEQERLALDAHIQDCASCGVVLARERQFHRALQALPVPEPGPDRLERMLSNAATRRVKEHRTRWWFAAVGGAIAAGLIGWLTIGPLLQPSAMQQPAVPVASVTMTLQEPRTIRLVFASPTQMRDARLDLSLPSGVELVGHEGRREIHWETSLQPGKNVLPLRLIVREGSGGELIARLKQGDRQKTFRVRVTVRRSRHAFAPAHGSARL